VAWRWKSIGVVEKGDFDAPNFTYPLRFCVYDSNDRVVLSALAPPGDTCAGRPCWTETETALRYRDPERTPDGISTLLLKAGTPGRIKLRGAGANLGLASLPVTTPLRVRTYTGAFAHCFAADFSTGVRANTEHIVRGTSD
jgi:hypothetical protein